MPVSLLQGSQKFIFEPVQDVQSSCTKLLNATIMELFTGCSELRDDYRHMYFALTFFHSIMQQRTRFGAIGWKAPYQFTLQDHQIAGLVNFSLMKEHKGDLTRSLSQLDTFAHYAASVIYGGHLQCERDQQLACALAQDVINRRAIREENYLLAGKPKGNRCELRMYVMPRPGHVNTLDFLHNHVAGFPMNDRPETCGAHLNVRQKTLKEEGESILNQIRLLEYPNKLQRAAQGSGDGSSALQTDMQGNQTLVKRQRTKLHDV